MALVQNVLIGKASGSVGEATFTTWKGKNVLKSKAQNGYSNPSQAQLNNNEKFAVMVALYRSIAGIVTSGFKAQANGQSEYNGFMQENRYSETVTGSPGSYKVDTSKLMISKGPEFTSSLGNFAKIGGPANNIQVTWDVSNPNLPSDTPVVVALFDRTTGTFLASQSGLYTTTGDFTFVGTGWGTNIATIDVYGFICNPLTGKACDSVTAMIA